MPIRINFLAEHQAREEARRRDPVKRAVLGAGVILSLLLAWGGLLQLRLMGARMKVQSSEAQFKQIEAKYQQARAAEAAVTHARGRLDALKTLASSRVLWGSCLNAIQHSSHDKVQLMQLQTRQSYTITPAVPAQTNTTGAITSPRVPAVSRESAFVLLDAKDTSADPGKGLIQDYQDLIAAQPFFQTNLDTIRMTALGQPQRDVAAGSPPFVMFSLECSFTERER
jgi:hypothetical protein